MQLEQKFRELMREFSVSNLYENLQPFKARETQLASDLDAELQSLTRIVLERLLTTSAEQFVKKHFVQVGFQNVKWIHAKVCAIH